MKTTRRILSLVLAMIMLLSAFSVVASAREIEIAQSGVTMTGGEVLYLKPNSNWTKDGARFAAYFFGTGDGWASMETCPRDAGYYKVTVPTGSWTNVIFCRMNPASTKNDWNSKWNQSADLVYDGTNNLFTVASGSWDGAKTTWSKWSETPAPTEPPVTEPEVVETEPEATQPEVVETEPEATQPEVVETEPEETQPEVVETEPEETQPEVVETEPEETQPEVVETMTIYFQNNWMWSDVHAYFWGSATTNSEGWPGDVAKLYGNDGTYDIYSVTVPADVTGVIFNGFDSGTNSSNQTPDIEDPKDGNCYYMEWDQAANKNAVGCEDISVILPEETQPEVVETEPEETKPEETQPEVVETEPEETKPEETQPEVVETEPEETTPEETQPEVVETEPEATQPEVVIPAGYYLVGTLNGVDKWFVDADATDRMFKENAEVAGEYMLDYTFVEGDEVKVVYFDGKEIKNWFNDGGDNYKIGATKAGDATVYFRAEGNADWSYYFFTVVPVVVPTEPEETTPEETEPEETQPEETEPEETQPEETQPEETQPEETQPEAGTMKIYFQNNWMWSDVSIYYWGVENAPQWPGNKMEKFGNDGTYDIYVAEVPTNVEGLLINGVKDDGSGQLDKTPDIKDAKDGNCYFMLWDNGNAVDFKDISEILPEETQPEETQPEETQPEETQPEETQPEETQPEETQPEETQPEVKVEKVTGLNATDVTRDSFTLTWDAIDGAKKYWVYVNGVIYNSTTENTITVTKRDVGTEYTVFITAYVNDYITKADVAEPITVTTLDYEYACDVTSDTYSINVAWDAVDCTKAWVYVGTDPENLKIYNSSKTGELTITGLESNTTYYVKVTYLIDGYIVEDTEIFDIATTADEALFITAEVVEDGIAVDWNALDGATKYWVTYETAEKTLVYSTTNDEFVIPNGKEDCTVSVKAAVNQKMVYFYSVDL